MVMGNTGGLRSFRINIISVSSSPTDELLSNQFILIEIEILINLNNISLHTNMLPFILLSF